MVSAKRVVIGTANHWTSPFRVGSHHYAEQFAAAGWDVAFVSDPISPLHRLFAGDREQYRERLAIHREGGRRFLGGRLWAYVPYGLATVNTRAVLRSRWMARKWFRATIPRLDRVIEREGFAGADVLWIDSPSQAWMLDHLPHRRSVVRVADHTAGLPKVPAALVEVETEAVRKADLVVATARRLEERAKRLRDGPVLYLPNGVDFGLFADGAPPPPPEYAAIPSPRAVYAGAIGPWFDADLIAFAARRLPRVHFILIGPPAADLSSVAGLPNVHLLGRKPHEQLPAYFRHAQVGIIPFKCSDLIQSVSPIKLFEYLAAGLPVVSVAWDEIAQYRGAGRVSLTFGAVEFASEVERRAAEGGGEPQRTHEWADSFRRVAKILEL